MSIGLIDEIPVACGGKVVNRAELLLEDCGVRGEELGAAPNSGNRMKGNMTGARVFQRDISRKGVFYLVRHQTRKSLDVKLLVCRRLYHRAGFILLEQ